VESQDDLDPALLVWDIHRRLNVDRLPSGRVVIRFDFRGLPRHCRSQKTFWLVLERPDVDVCLKDPGFEVDLSVSADLRTRTRAWLGDIRLTDASGRAPSRSKDPGSWLRPFPGGSR
jgi:hypothetical protein